jgi:DNA-binding NarL/FixJ family response regulator
MTISTLIVDDQPLMRTGFRMILEAAPGIDVAGEAADGLEAVDQARRLQPDVVLMDIRMPRLDGIEATRRIVAQGARTRVLMLTTFDLQAYVFRALQAGASGFLLKEVPPAELVVGIAIVARGEALLSPTITRRLIEDFALAEAPGPAPTGLDDLTDREREVLGLIARGMSNAEIAASLVVSETTIKTHVGHVLEKLDVRDRVQAVVVAYEAGIVRPGAYS